MKKLVVILSLFYGISSCDENDSEEHENHAPTAEYDYSNALEYFNENILELDEDKIKQKAISQFDEVVEDHNDSPLSDTAKMYLDSIEYYSELIKEETKNSIDKILKKLRVDYDKFEEYSWYKDKNTVQYSNRNSFHLYVGISGEEGDFSGNKSIRLKIQYYEDDWLFIKKYTILTDENKYTLYPDDLDTDVTNGGMISENYTKLITESDMPMLEDISTSDVVEIKFTGKQYSDNRKLSSKEKQGIANILEFYNLIK